MGYEWMVDLDQEADFIGKEALKRIKAEGVSRKLVGVEIEGPGLGSYNDSSMIDYFQVWKDGKPVGQITSACYSPRLEKNIGYAMLPIELTEFGTELEVEARPDDRPRSSCGSRSSTRRRTRRSRRSRSARPRRRRTSTDEASDPERSAARASALRSHPAGRRRGRDPRARPAGREGHRHRVADEGPRADPGARRAACRRGLRGRATPLRPARPRRRAPALDPRPARRGRAPRGVRRRRRCLAAGRAVRERRRPAARDGRPRPGA